MPFATSTATLAGLIVLIPGFMLTIAIRELSTRHLASGTARLVGAGITFLGIIFGVALGNRLALDGRRTGAARARSSPSRPGPLR